MIKDRIKEFRRVRAGDLRPHPRNWRTHSKAQQAALRGILAEVGYAEALVAYVASDGKLTLVDGHLRADLDKEAEVPCLILDVTDAEAEKLLLTLDPLAEMAGSEPRALEELLGRVATQSGSLQGLLDDLADRAKAKLRWDKVEEEQAAGKGKAAKAGKRLITKSGDLWILGNHRLLCGDSTKAEDVARALGQRKPFLMVTDPPYGVDYDPGWRTPMSRGVKTTYVENDDRAAWAAAFVHFPGDVAYVWHSALHAVEVAAALLACKFEIRSQIIWAKNRAAISRGSYHWGHEPCFYAVRSGANAKWAGGRKQKTVWADIVDGVLSATGDETYAVRVDASTVGVYPGEMTSVWNLDLHRGKDYGDHPTPKPIECMARPMRHHGGTKDDVFDPFLGSGTTLIAAEQEGRRCCGLELEPAHCDTIVRRWEALTGKKAKRQ